MRNWNQFFRYLFTPVGVMAMGVVVSVLTFMVSPELGRELLDRLVEAVSQIVFALLPLILVIAGMGLLVKKVFKG